MADVLELAQIDLEGVGAARSPHSMPCISDDDAQVTVSCEANGRLDFLDRLGYDGVQGYTSLLAGDVLGTVDVTFLVLFRETLPVRIYQCTWIVLGVHLHQD